MTHTLTVDSRENIGGVVICYGKIDITSYTAWYTASNDKVVVRGRGVRRRQAEPQWMRPPMSVRYPT